MVKAMGVKKMEWKWLMMGGLLAGGLLGCWLVLDVLQGAKPQGKVEQADSFVVLGFGLVRTAGGQEAAGASNQALAAWLVEHNPERKPAIVQQGVYLALQALVAQQPELHPLDEWVTVLPHDAQAYVDTRGAVLQSWVLMRQLGCSWPAVVSHQLQMRRAGWLFERLPLDGVILPHIQGIPFDADSVHPQTRSLVRYLAFEASARLIGWLMRWY